MNEAVLLELVEIIQRQRETLVAYAGLDVGLTDYSVRQDLLRLLKLADEIKKP